MGEPERADEVGQEDHEPSDPTIGISLERSPSVPPPPLLDFGRYRVLGRLAVGGMAEIFLAEEAAGHSVRRVVIKVLRHQFRDDPAFETLFQGEGSLAMRLTHPNICTVYDFGRQNDLFFIAMEHVDGVTLWTLLRRLSRTKRVMPPAVAVAILSRVAAALDYAHNAKDSQRKPLGIVHRDVSPHNVMVRFDGVVKLLDFGVAKVRSQDENAEKSMVKGKSAYFSPEQCQAKPLDGRCDVFALGICLYESLTGHRLFRREGHFETFRAIVQEPPPDLSDQVDSELATIVRVALAKSPDDRYPSAGAMHLAMERWLSEQREIFTEGRLERFISEVMGEDATRSPLLERGPEAIARLRANTPPPIESLPTRRAGWPAIAVVAVVAVGLGSWLSLRTPVESGAAATSEPESDRERELEEQAEALQAQSLALEQRAREQETQLLAAAEAARVAEAARAEQAAREAEAGREEEAAQEREVHPTMRPVRTRPAEMRPRFVTEPDF